MSGALLFVAGVLVGLLSVAAAAAVLVLRLSSRAARTQAKLPLPSKGGRLTHATASSASRIPRELYRPHLVTDVESCVWFSAFCGRMYRDFIAR